MGDIPTSFVGFYLLVFTIPIFLVSSLIILTFKFLKKTNKFEKFARYLMLWCSLSINLTIGYILIFGLKGYSYPKSQALIWLFLFGILISSILFFIIKKIVINKNLVNSLGLWSISSIMFNYFLPSLFDNPAKGLTFALFVIFFILLGLTLPFLAVFLVNFIIKIIKTRRSHSSFNFNK